MMIELLDITIILVYLVWILTIGLVVRKRAKRSKDDYFLGGKSIPWYMLGISNASGMFDISGTMWLVSLTFVYGLKSIWIPWLWPVFNQIFLMVYLSTWLRRSNVTTGAEWIFFRFGKAKGGQMSHTIVVIFAVVSCLGFLAYGFIGLGKFVEIFLPWELVSTYVPFDLPLKYVPHFYGAILTFFAVFYSVLGGMTGIVWADILQFAIMTISSVVVAVLAWNAVGEHSLLVPETWSNPFFGWKLDLDWRGIITGVNQKIASDGYSLFGIFFMLVVFKGILVSVAGPEPNYDMQKILSAKTPSEAAKMSGLVSFVLLPVRYLMIGGFAVLGIIFYDQLDLGNIGSLDFEKILPSAIGNFVPIGFLGLILAGLLAAFISTFAGTLNAAQAYLLNDIYLRHKKNAISTKLSLVNYATGIAILLVSITIGFYIQDINSITQWIVSALWGGYIVSNILKWHWWRFNGEGYFWGMLSGLIPAIIFPLVFESTLELHLFPILLLITIAGCLVGTYSAPPTEEAKLIDFYRKTRPWGFWKPIHDKVIASDPSFKKNTLFKDDMANIFTGVTAQTLLMAAPLYLILHDYFNLTICLLIFLFCTIRLKKQWWDKLGERL